MLPLDSPEWNKLKHAYGSAANIPELLEQARSDPTPKSGFQSEPWYSLWSALCHQGDVYTASYASVPHLVEIAATSSGKISDNFFALPAMIEICRHEGQGPPIPTEHAKSYADSLTRLHDIAFAQRNRPWSHEMSQSIACALAVSKGHHRLGKCFMELGETTLDDFFRLMDEGKI